MIKIKLIALLLCVSAVMSAQFKFSFGIKGGAESSIESFNAANIGYCYGGFVNVGVGKVISIKPELLYYTMTRPSFGTPSDNEVLPNVEFGYKSIPVLLHLQLGRGFSLEAGPQFNKVTNADENRQAQDYMNWALGFNFHMSKSVHMTFRYMTGGDPYYIDNRVEYTNSSVMVGLGISLFTLKEHTFRTVQ